MTAVKWAILEVEGESIDITVFNDDQATKSADVIKVMKKAKKKALADERRAAP